MWWFWRFKRDPLINSLINGVEVKFTGFDPALRDRTAARRNARRVNRIARFKLRMQQTAEQAKGEQR